MQVNSLSLNVWNSELMKGFWGEQVTFSGCLYCFHSQRPQSNQTLLISQEVNFDCGVFVEMWRPSVDKTPAILFFLNPCKIRLCICLFYVVSQFKMRVTSEEVGMKMESPPLTNQVF